MRRLALAALALAASVGADAAGRPMPRPGPDPAVDAAGPVARPDAAAARLCGSRDLVGRPLPPIDGPGGCDVARPVELRSVAGLALAPQPTLACETARAVEQWVETAVKPEAARARTRVVGLDVADDYACRGRNRATTGKLSAHAKGQAIDIRGFRLAGGDAVTVVEHWDGRRYGRMLRRIYAAGCGPFTTTLGPGSDAFHEDHLHFDVEPRRRPYCR